MKVGNALDSIFVNSGNNNKAEVLKKLNRKEVSFDNMLKEAVEARKAAPEIHKKAMDKKLMDVCIQMESLFVSRMLKEMRNTLPKTKLVDGGFAEQVFEDMLYDEYALSLSKSAGLGLADMIYKDLSRY